MSDVRDISRWGAVRHPFTPRFSRFARDHANWDGLRAVCLTIDQDWAPDYMTARVLAILADHGAKATVFAASESRLLESLGDTGEHEIGLHPNLLPGSTQGGDLAEIVDRLRARYPGAVGTRFHLLSHSYRDLAWLGARGFRYDVSSLRLNCPYLLPAWHPDLGMSLFSYSWEDAYEVEGRLPVTLDSIDLASPGVKILNFHPLNVFLNAAEGADRARFRQACPDLSSCPEENAGAYRRSGTGTEALLVELLRELSRRSVRMITMSEVDGAYRASLDGVAE